MTECSVKGCDKEVVRADRCAEHPRPNLPPSKYLGRAKTSRVGKDRKRVALPPGMPPVVVGDERSHLVDCLANAVGYDHACAIADALAIYLEAEPAESVLQFTPPNPKAELDKAIKQRDEAVARAEKAERELRHAGKARAK